MEKKIFTILFTAMMAIVAFSSCSDDDEPKTVLGEEILLNINKVIVEQANAEKLYQRGEDGSTLVMIADSKEPPISCASVLSSTGGMVNNAR